MRAETSNELHNLYRVDAIDNTTAKHEGGEKKIILASFASFASKIPVKAINLLWIVLRCDFKLLTRFNATCNKTEQHSLCMNCTHIHANIQQTFPSMIYNFACLLMRTIDLHICRRLDISLCDFSALLL